MVTHRNADLEGHVGGQRLQGEVFLPSMLPCLVSLLGGNVPPVSICESPAPPGKAMQGWTLPGCCTSPPLCVSISIFLAWPQGA